MSDLMSACRPSPRTIAVMQPYFFPYAGYFRLFAVADLVVLFDCVQFPRRGWVHRNRLRGDDGQLHWLSLPLRKADYTARINQMVFGDGAADRLATAVRRFPALRRPQADVLIDMPSVRGGSNLADYLENRLAVACHLMGLPCRMLRSSSLALADDLKGQQRVLAVAERLGADRYVNPPGGRGYYDAAVFAAAGIELRFLPPFTGPSHSVLPRLLDEDAAALGNEVRCQSQLEPA